MPKRRTKKPNVRLVIVTVVVAVLGLFTAGYEVGEAKQVQACESRLLAVGGTPVGIGYICDGRALPAE